MKLRSLKSIDGNGQNGTCFHLMEGFGGEVRFQVNAGDVVYLKDMREVRKIARWLNRFADSKKRKRK